MKLSTFLLTVFIGSCIAQKHENAEHSIYTEGNKDNFSSVSVIKHDESHHNHNSDSQNHAHGHHDSVKENDSISDHEGHAVGLSTSSDEETHSEDHHHPENHSDRYVDHSKHVMMMDQPVMVSRHDPHNHGDGDLKDDEMPMDHSMHGMKMYFHTGVMETVLFKEWMITNVGGMIGSMIGIFLLAMFYEGLKYFREYIFKQYVSSIQFSTVAVTGESGRVNQVHKVERHRMLSWPHALQTFLHVIQMIMSYFLMLIFMTYNIWLCIAVILGAGSGYFVFGWKKASVVDITEHCH